MEFQKAVQFRVRKSDTFACRQLITGDLQISMSEERRQHNLLYWIWRDYFNLIDEFESNFTSNDLVLFDKWDKMYRPLGRDVDCLYNLECHILRVVRYETGIETVLPERIGALTEAPILGVVEHAHFDGASSYEDAEKDYSHVWWYEPYQVRSFVEDLIRNGESIWPSAQ